MTPNMQATYAWLKEQGFMIESKRGIDYAGRDGTCNRDLKTGIRYGIIPLHELNEFAHDSFNPEYDECCPYCGEDWPADIEMCGRPDKRTTLGFTPYGADCPACGEFVREDDTTPDEPSRITLDEPGYEGMLASDNDVWIFRSPYFTRAAFCSPCAPGACYLTSPCVDGERAYCLGPEWFDEDNPAPYPIYSVETGALVKEDSNA